MSRRPHRSTFAPVALLALGAFCGCASNASTPLEGRPLTPDEIEYQRQLELSDHRPLDERGRSDLLIKLDQNLENWHRARIEQIGAEDRRLVENLEEILQRTVYLNFDVILGFLRDGDAPQRAIAAAAIGFSRLKEPKDEDERRRFLERWPQVYERAIPLLVGQLDAPESYVVQNALLGLWKLGDPKTPLEPILVLVDSPDAEVRAMAVLALSTVLTAETGETAISALMNALHDGSPKVRNHAVTAVGNIAHPNAAGRLAQLLNDQYMLVQANAARSLGLLGNPRNIEFLLVRLETLEATKPSGKHRPVSGLDQRRALVAQRLIESLEQLSGESYGDDVEKWRKWWDDEGRAAATG
ncbi:MAG: HEAT repeat domain-containing protein [Planctomycetota bacterium JB042]